MSRGDIFLGVCIVGLLLAFLSVVHVLVYGYEHPSVKAERICLENGCIQSVDYTDEWAICECLGENNTVIKKAYRMEEVKR